MKEGLRCIAQCSLVWSTGPTDPVDNIILYYKMFTFTGFILKVLIVDVRKHKRNTNPYVRI